MMGADICAQLGMLMFVVANIVGSTIQITTLPLPVLSTLQAVSAVFALFWCVCYLLLMSMLGGSPDSSSIPSLLP